MTTWLWAIAGAIGVLWPARLAGPLDGAPLDQRSEAVLIGGVLAVLAWAFPLIFKKHIVRSAIVALLAWKALTAATVTQDGWCLTFTSPVPIYRATDRVPHSWDVRADWTADYPRCSAVMTSGFDVLERFPVWFYNLPPANDTQPAEKSDRPPNVALGLDLDGYLQNDAPGVFQLLTGEDVDASVSIDGAVQPARAMVSGVTVPAGQHHVHIQAHLTKSHWSLEPRWDGRNLWTATTATMTPTSGWDSWFRSWGWLVPPLLIGLLMVGSALAVIERAGSRMAIGAAAVLVAVFAGVPLIGSNALTRSAPILLFGIAALPLPRRVRNQFGASLLVLVPFFALIVMLGLPQAGIFTWYSSGDDWWMFQRYAYRIFMEGYWLEGGSQTFWFQPLYRWIAGALHMAFGDSSIGELYWDGLCMAAGAAFAGHVARTFAGFRAGIIAAALTLMLFTMGPAWYLFGRGLSELSSMGLLYAAALCALRGRNGDRSALLAAAVLGSLAFYTRLNNLPMLVALVGMAWPVTQPVGEWIHPRALFAKASRPVAAAILLGAAVAMWLFTARTWYYTGVIDMFHGTQASHLSVWTQANSFVEGIQLVSGSLMMVLAMSDPPRLDPRAVPVMFGVLAAVAGVLRLGRFRSLPLNASALCLAGMVGSFVARGTAYPGRFSVHLIPITVALSVCAVSLFLKDARVPRLLPRARRSPGTTSAPANQSPTPG